MLGLSGQRLSITERTISANPRLRQSHKPLLKKVYQPEVNNFEHIIANHYLNLRRDKTELGRKVCTRIKQNLHSHGRHLMPTCREVLKIPRFSFPRLTVQKYFLIEVLYMCACFFNYRFGENFTWRGRQTLCNIENTEISFNGLNEIRNAVDLTDIIKLFRKYDNLIKRSSQYRNNQWMNGGSHDNVDATENIELYFKKLASDCYVEGFQYHLNYLTDCIQRAKNLNDNFCLKRYSCQFDNNKIKQQTLIVNSYNLNICVNINNLDKQTKIHRPVKINESLCGSNANNYDDLLRNSLKKLNVFNKKDSTQTPNIILTDCSTSSVNILNSFNDNL